MLIVRQDRSKLYDVQLPAVLDMKWYVSCARLTQVPDQVRCHRDMSVTPLLGIADSEGGLSLQELDVENVGHGFLQSDITATEHDL